jgi:uncharacterized protein YqeY
MLNQLKENLKLAIKTNSNNKEILRVIIGEIDRLPNLPTTQEIYKLIRKFIQNNEETIQLSKNELITQKLIEENNYMNSLLPTQLSQEEIINKLEEIKSEIMNAKSEGQAVGIAMKFLKDCNPQGKLVSNAIQILRN